MNFFFDQNKQIWQILKNKKSKIQKSTIRELHVHKNRNKTSIQPILKSNSTSFMSSGGGAGGMGEQS